MFKKTTLAMLTLLASSSVMAVPSVKVCNDRVGLIDNVYFDESCSTAYVGFPEFGYAEVNNYSKANEQLCDAYNSSMDAFVDTEKTQAYLVKRSNALALERVALEQKIGDMNMEQGRLETDLTSVAARRDELQLARDEAQDSYMAALNAFKECKLLAVDVKAECGSELQEFKLVGRARAELDKKLTAVKRSQRSLTRQVASLRSTVQTLNRNHDDLEVRVANLKAAVSNVLSTTLEGVKKYTQIYGGSATLLFETQLTDYVKNKRAQFGDLHNMSWGSVRPRAARIDFIAPNKGISLDEVKQAMYPTLKISTPNFPLFKTNLPDYSKKDESREPVPVQKPSYTSGEFDDLSKAFPSSFASTVTLNLHGACPVPKAQKRDLLTHVAAHVTTSFELKGNVSYEATVKRDAIIKFVKREIQAQFINMQFLKEKIRAEEDMSAYVEIKFTASNYEGTVSQAQIKQTLQQNLMERATVAILDTIAERKTVDPALLQYIEQQPGEFSQPPKNDLENITGDGGATTALCMTGNVYACAAGWVIDNTSLSVHLVDYEKKVKHRYQEKVTEDFFIPMHVTFGYKAK